MAKKISYLNIVRLGNFISFTALKEIGNKIVESFSGMIDEFRLSHHDTPAFDRIDAYLLTMILNEAYGGHTLGVTAADLRTDDDNEFYNSIFGGKNPKNDIAVVSIKKLSPETIDSERDYDLLISRTLKVSIHEVGHNFGLTDHASYRVARDGALCPMSKGETNKFGYRGYVRAIIDGRGQTFCDECTNFLRKVHGYKQRLKSLVMDSLSSKGIASILRRT
jgi:predicted Zn-dependent protease